MKVLVDTSVWSAALGKGRAEGSPAVEQLRKHVLRGEVVLLGVILQEVLQGFRAAKAFGLAASKLSAFPLLQLGRADHVDAAELRRKCASKGITASTVDCQIASAAIHHRCRLLTLDHDFEHIARVSALRLA